MALIEWNDSYNIDIAEIDDQHKLLVQIINNLHNAITTNKNPEVIGDIIDKINDYANFHFRTEEIYFDEYGYTEAEDHILKHNEFREKAKEFKQKFQNDENGVGDEVLDYLEKWLIEHIQGEDQQYVSLFRSKSHN